MPEGNETGGETPPLRRRKVVARMSGSEIRGLPPACRSAHADYGLGLVARDIVGRDVPRADLVLGQLRSRNLPIPAAIFAERPARALKAMRGEG